MPPSPLPPVDVLAVDDTPANLRSLEVLLEDLGVNMVTASSGSEALRHLLEREFALILLDVQMPGIDGLETARLVRARERTRHIPIIFVTAHHRSEDNVSRGYELGAVDYLFKPIVPEVLRTKVSVFLELHRRSQEVKAQAELLRQASEREHARELAEARARYEQSLLREEMERERKVAEALGQRAEELARLVAEKQRAEEALRDADRRKDEFLAMLAHELRNPLAPVRHALEVVRVRSGSDDVVRRTLASAERQVVHMTRLVDDLLDVSRITRGRVELRRGTVALADVVEAAVQACEPDVRKRGHALVVELPEEAVLLDADATRLTQVVANLLHNASKYTPEGGRLRLWATPEEGWVSVSVRDSGIGIREDMLQRVFELFVQVDPTSDRAQGGLGLGLTLVRRLVEMHGGTVHARSEGPGKGSEFVVRLPRLAATAASATATAAAAAAVSAAVGAGVPAQLLSAAARRAPAAPGKPPPLRILLVEDNADIRDTLRELLELQGHSVQEAADGRAGVDLALSAQPQVALVDIGLPELDGYQVAELVRQAAGAGAPRLVALTGYGHEDDRRRALDAGFDAHLVKPVSSEELNLVLRTLCPPTAEPANAGALPQRRQLPG
jgi:signal transduction histidine kinase